MSITAGAPIELLGISVGSPAAVVPSGGAITSHTHVQDTPATVWIVQHNLGRYPAAVSAFSADFSTQWDGFAVQHVTSNLLYITADVAIAGKALVS
ncbi:hypothetical protein [Amycolatopsis kentuckyensis]|uniref:hypothetical protein n=1 Tax=Amycolatopsis kentuckyensis TaxID=218823 RepID=UPI0035627F02